MIKQAGQSFPIEDRKSKFIASAAPVTDESEAHKFIERTKERHNKATHNVFAYRLKKEDYIIPNADDDGEVPGCAGDIILYVMEKQKIVNTVIVVSRYYGGTKLGKGGLVRNYSDATTTIIKAIGTKKYEKTNK